MRLHAVVFPRSLVVAAGRPPSRSLLWAAGQLGRQGRLPTLKGSPGPRRRDVRDARDGPPGRRSVGVGGTPAGAARSTAPRPRGNLATHPPPPARMTPCGTRSWAPRRRTTTKGHPCP
ncbi:hypothetical protein STRAU_4849 [Streptomyces aurantiacus JA 4570]|uniref:Uncharacterized protein n=1 Tax=Streptomyces aurantiacus JA 4570 TaxID=1286094 RepID=S4AL04_9ACTN|nr:hypothetical protein STRAU_4849 [Streptomyces aurantiacus JA 4570]